MGAFGLASSPSAAGFGAGTAPGTDKATARAAAGTSHTGQNIEGEMDFSPIQPLLGEANTGAHKWSWPSEDSKTHDRLFAHQMKKSDPNTMLHPSPPAEDLRFNQPLKRRSPDTCSYLFIAFSG